MWEIIHNHSHQQVAFAGGLRFEPKMLYKRPRHWYIIFHWTPV